MKKVTIYEVAKEAHVSLATVSRVINGSNVVKEDTKKRVEEAITKLGYRPNAIAQGLALSRTTTVGLILPSTSVSFFSRVINGLCDVAKIYDYNVFLHTITEGVTDIKEIIDEVIKSRVDGVIIYADKDLDDSVKLLEEYSEAHDLDKEHITLIDTPYLDASLKALAEESAKNLGFRSVNWIKTGCVITCHGGPKAFGIVGFSK